MLRRIQRRIILNVNRSSHIRYSCQILMALESSRQIFEKKCSNIEFHENPSSVRRVVPCGWTDGQTDMTKLIVAFYNFENATKNR